MGTNYYAKMNKCETCGRFDHAHLGKLIINKSATFITNLNKTALEDYIDKSEEIKDEYGKIISKPDMLKIINNVKLEIVEWFGFY